LSLASNLQSRVPIDLPGFLEPIHPTRVINRFITSPAGFASSGAEDTRTFANITKDMRVTAVPEILMFPLLISALYITKTSRSRKGF
jgi:hypothetical protein